MEKRKLNLALQGGGAHGAFTWGVLDRLLQEKDLFVLEVYLQETKNLHSLNLLQTGFLQNRRYMKYLLLRLHLNDLE